MFKDFGEWEVSPEEATPDWIKKIGGIAYRQGDVDMYAAVRKGHFDSDCFFRVLSGDVVAASLDFSEIQGEGQFIGYSGDDAGERVATVHAWMDHGDPAQRFVWDGEVVRQYRPEHAEFRAAAMVRINTEHAKFLRHLTGDATVEERDTWKTKELAARALIAGDASDGQMAMLSHEAAGAGVEPVTLAQVIIAKAEGFQALIGMAAGLKAKAKTAIYQATDDAVVAEQIGPALEAVFASIDAEVQTAVQQWQNG